MIVGSPAAQTMFCTGRCLAMTLLAAMVLGSPLLLSTGTPFLTTGNGSIAASTLDAGHKSRVGSNTNCPLGRWCQKSANFSPDIVVLPIARRTAYDSAHRSPRRRVADASPASCGTCDAARAQ